MEAAARRCKGFAKVKWTRRRRRTQWRSAAARPSESVRMKVRKLQKLIPGGQGLQPDRLFLRTADYIVHLNFQLNVLQALSKTYQLS